MWRLEGVAYSHMSQTRIQGMVDLTKSVCVTLYHPLNCLWGDRLSCANGIQFLKCSNSICYGSSNSSSKVCYGSSSTSICYDRALETHQTSFWIDTDTSSNSSLQQWLKLARRRHGMPPQQCLSREVFQDVIRYCDVSQQHHFLNHVVGLLDLVHAHIQRVMCLSVNFELDLWRR